MVPLLSHSQSHSLVLLLQQFFTPHAGAQCTGTLDPDTHFLISDTAEGPKFAAAVAWGVARVVPDWVYQSVKLGFAQDPVRLERERGREGENGVIVLKLQTKVSLLLPGIVCGPECWHSELRPKALMVQGILCERNSECCGGRQH